MRTAGVPLDRCRTAAILLHGRGRTPDEMIALAEQFAVPDVAYLAPRATEQTWYPYSFLEPLERNEPALSGALAVCAGLVAQIRAAGVPNQRIVLLGFSQGACLAAQFVYQYPTRYGGVVLFTGGLIGPPGTTWAPTGTFGGAPILLSGANHDPFVPAWRMEETAAVFRGMDAAVVEQIYTSSEHVVTPAEIAATSALLATL